MKTIYMPLSARAKRLFEEYKEQGFKVGRITDEAVMFVNKECDDEKFDKTFIFGFWIFKKDLAIHGSESDEPREIPFTGTFLNELRETAKPLAEWVGWDVDEILEMAALRAGPDATKEKLLVEAMKIVHEMFDVLTKEIQNRIDPPADLDLYRSLKEIDKSWDGIMDLANEAAKQGRGDVLQEMLDITEPLVGEIKAMEEAQAARQKAAQDDPTITLGDELDSKDIYLRKLDCGTTMICGLHAVGGAGPYEYTLTHLDGSVEKKCSNFMAMDAWGNEYDNEHNMLGRGSFRLHTSDIEEYAKEMEAEGWERYEGPKRKLPIDT